MDTSNFYRELRSETLAIISGTDDANPDIGFDDSTPNWVTKDKIQDLLDRSLEFAKGLGILKVLRHMSCPIRDHNLPFPLSETHGMKLKFRDPQSDYQWSGKILFYGEKICICPCRKKNLPTKHLVIEDLIYKKTANVAECTDLISILEDLQWAIDAAGDRKPRSAIREQLLKAILKINDKLLPKPMAQYLESSSPKGEGFQH